MHGEAFTTKPEHHTPLEGLWPGGRMELVGAWRTLDYASVASTKACRACRSSTSPAARETVRNSIAIRSELLLSRTEYAATSHMRQASRISCVATPPNARA